MEGKEERDESFVTADDDEEDTTAIPHKIDYDMSPAIVCIDCSMDVAVTPREVSFSTCYDRARGNMTNGS
jgi:hypothetical protein